MKPLSDAAMARLRAVVDLPDLTGTRYRIIRALDSGGMGTVYLARDLDLDREVALKVLSAPDPAGDLAARMRQEARHLARLEHPNIVPVHDAGSLPDARPYYAMRLVRGRRLDQWMGGAGRLARLRLFRQVCGAVAFAHAQGVIHRDLKPENIMVGPLGEALVLDWGVARLLTQPWAEPRSSPPAGQDAAPGPNATVPGAVIGTPAYMAPEQARGQTDRIDARADVYALGAILHCLLAGRPPFEADSTESLLEKVRTESAPPLRRIDRSIPRAVEAICLKAMASDPASRYASARELSDEVERFLDGLPVTAHRETLLERAGRFIDRNRTLVWLLVAYLVMRVAVLALAGR